MNFDKKKLKSLLDRLERQYNYAYPLEDATSFFIGIADYVKIVEDSDYLSAIVNAFILNERDEEFSKIKEISEKVVEEVKGTFNKLEEIIKDNDIKSDYVKAELDEYTSFIEGRLHISGYGNYATHLSDMVRDIIIAIKESEHEDKIKDFAVYGHQGIITDWKISETEKELHKMLRRFEERKGISIWNAWEQLWWAYNTTYNKHEFSDKIEKGKNFMELMNFGLLSQDMQKVMEGKEHQSEYRHFKIPEYKRHFFRAHDKIKFEAEALLATDNEPVKKIDLQKEQQPTEKWYAPESGTGLIKGKKFNLIEGKDKFKLFSKLVEVKKLLRQEVIEVLNLPDETNDKTNHSLNTYKINEIVKELRKTTHLDKTELINNGCNITLLAEVKIKSPNIT